MNKIKTKIIVEGNGISFRYKKNKVFISFLKDSKEIYTNEVDNVLENDTVIVENIKCSMEIEVKDE